MTKDEEDDDLGKTPSQPPVSMLPILPAWLARTKVISLDLIATRKVTTRQNVSNQGRTAMQKTSNCLDNLRFSDCG